MPNPLWTVTGALGTARRSPTATLLGNGRVLVAGGAGDENAILDSAELYDPQTGTWNPTGNLEIARVEHTATLLADGRVLVAGGRTLASGSIKDAELYDPASGTWTTTGGLADARRSHTATLLRTGQVLAAGGSDDNFGDRLASAELYDPVTGKWSATGSLTLDNGRTEHTAALLQDGRVLVAGGLTFGPFLLKSAEIYDPKSGTWAATANASVVRTDHTINVLQSGEVLLAAGVKSNGLEDQLDTAELYDPGASTFVETGKLRTPRAQHTATRLTGGQILVAGGSREVTVGGVTLPKTLRSVELYDPDSRQWSETAEMNEERSKHAAVLLTDGTVLVVGGAKKVNLSIVPLKHVEFFSGA